MFRKSENARRDWSPELVMSCSVRQKAILSDAARMVRPGGILVYSTCTFSKEENEEVISQLLANNRDFVLEDIKQVAGASSDMPGTLRLMPHRIHGEGHFIASLQREGGMLAESRKPMKRERLPASALESYREFCQGMGISAVPEEHLQISGSYLYKKMELAPDLSGVRVIHPGLWLGTIHHSERNRIRFEPAHALAMALPPQQVQHIAVLDRQAIVEYLKGMPISLPGPDGWVLACMDQYSMGWGKRVKGIVKNYYPRGLRWH